MRPGRGDMTISRVAMNSASSTLWVMKNTILPVLLPDVEDQLLHGLAGEGVERAERLVHQQHRGSLVSARARPTRCCMPPESW